MMMDPLRRAMAKRELERDLERKEMLHRIEEQADRVRAAVDVLQQLIREGRNGPQNGAAT